MAGEVHGSSTRVHVAGWDLSPQLNSSGTEETIDTADVTAFVDGSRRYIAGLDDGTFSAEGFYNYDAPILDSIEAALKAIKKAPSSVVCLWPEGDVIGKRGDALCGVETAKSVSTDIGDAVKVSMALQSKAGVEDVVSLHALGAEPAVANFASVDNGAVSALGGAGVLHVADVGTNVTVKIQHSADNVTFVDLVSFALATDRGSQRVRVAGNVNRYVRAIVSAITGGPATFAVGFTRTPSTTS